MFISNLNFCKTFCNPKISKLIFHSENKNSLQNSSLKLLQQFLHDDVERLEEEIEQEDERQVEC